MENGKLQNDASRYIPLREAVKFCNYSQEYLALRVRQGKLKAVKLGRNWVTTHEWLENYLQKVGATEIKDDSEKSTAAIMVQPCEAAPDKSCDSLHLIQDRPPDNLPVGQDLSQDAAEKNRSHIGVYEILSILSGFRKPFGTLRPSFMFGLVFVLLAAGSVSGKDSLQYVYKEISNQTENFADNFESADFKNIFTGYGQWVNENFKSQLANFKHKYSAAGEFIEEQISQKQKEIGELSDLSFRGWSALGEKIASADIKLPELSMPEISVPKLAMPEINIPEIKLPSIQLPKIKVPKFTMPEISLPEISLPEIKMPKIVMPELPKLSMPDLQIKEKLSNISDAAQYRYLAANIIIEDKLLNALGKASASVEDNLVQGENKIKDLGLGLKSKIFNTLKFISSPWQGIFIGQEESTQLKSEISESEKEPVVIQRVEVEKVVEPVKEITKEVETIRQITKVDDAALAELRAGLSYLEGEIGKRLYAPGGVISQTIRVTEPVQSPKIYQENGEIVLQTRGSGNVILSAATGLQMYGQQVIIESTSKLNPLIYLASKSRIDGSLTVNGSITGGALSASSIGASGVATVGGNLTVGGDITVSGNGTFSGVTAISASSTSAILTVTQTGSGDVVNFKDDTTEVFTIIDGGNVGISSTTPTDKFSVQGNIISSGNVLFYGTAATTTIKGGLLVGTDTLYVPAGGKVGIASSTPSDQFAVQGNILGSGNIILYSSTASKFQGGFISNSSSTFAATTTVNTGGFVVDGNRLYVSENGRVGIGTITPDYKLTVSGAASISAGLISTASSTFGNVILQDLAITYGVSAATSTITATSTLGSINADSGLLYVDAYADRVGIASSTPSDKFSVQGNIISSGDILFYGTAATTTIKGGLLVGTNTLYVPSGGNVGIASSTPSDQFAVQGNILGSGNIILYSSTASKFQGGFISNSSSTIAATTTVNTGGFVVDGSRLYVSENGRVGIGTITPDYKLTVSGAASISAGLISTASSTFGSISMNDLALAYGVSAATSTITATSTLGSINADSGLLYVDAYADRVGIASSTPTDKFSVQGNIISSGDILFYGTAATTTIKGGLLVGTNTLYVPAGGKVGIASSTPSDQLAVQGNIIGSGNLIIYGSAASKFQGGFISNSSSTFAATTTVNTGGFVVDGNRLYVSENGRVGIGTLTPDYKLTVSGSASISGGIVSTASSTLGNVTLQDLAAAYGVSAATSTITATSTLGSINADSGLLYVDAYADRVGISSTTPTDKFSVQGNIISSGNVLFYGTAATTTIKGGLLVGTDTLYVPAGGKVGIASSTPSDQLAVQGNIIGSGNLVIYGSATSTYAGGLQATAVKLTTSPSSNYVLTSDANGFGSWQSLATLQPNTWQFIGPNAIRPTTTVGIIVSASSTFAGDLTVNSDQYPLGASLFIDASEGRVGIGTTTLAGLLTVGTTTPALVVSPTGKVGIGTANPAQQLEVAGIALVTNELLVGVSSDASDPSYAFNGDEDTGMGRTLGMADTLFLSTNGSSRLWINSSGLVGISTTTPRYTLDIWGDMAIGTSTGVTAGQNYPMLYVNTGEGGTSNGVGIGTTTVSGTMLTVGTSTPAFVVSQNGRVGIASSTPSDQLAVQGNIIGSGNIILYGSATSTYAGGIQATAVKLTQNPSAGYVLTSDDNGYGYWAAVSATGDGSSNWQYIGQNAIRPTSTIGIIVNASSTFAGDLTVGSAQYPLGASLFVDASEGRVGIGTTTLAGLLTVGTTTPAFVITSAGTVGIASSTPSAQLAVQGNIIGSGNLIVYGSNTTSTFYHPVAIIDSSDAQLKVAQSATQYSMFQTNAAGDLTINLTGDAITIPDDNLYICAGDACPAVGLTGTGNLQVEGDIVTSGLIRASTTISGTRFLDYDDPSTYYVDPATTSIFNKITAVTLDPPHKIDGKWYATYISDYAGGVRTEITSVIRLEKSGADFTYIFDFDKLEKESDLWLFWNTSNKDFKDLVVILTPGTEGKTWYVKKPETNELIIYGEEAAEVSYRLTLKRWDWEQHSNFLE